MVHTISGGLSPIEIEESITKKIENKLESVPGVKNIFSSSMENASVINVEMDRRSDMYVALQDVNNAVDQINFNVDIFFSAILHEGMLNNRICSNVEMK